MFEFWYFPRLAIQSTIPSHDGGLWPWVTSPSATKSPNRQRIHLVLQTVCTQITIPFSLSLQYSINYRGYSMLYHKIGFVFDDIAQPSAHATLLSTFKVGYTELWCSISYVAFSIIMDLSGPGPIISWRFG